MKLNKYKHVGLIVWFLLGLQIGWSYSSDIDNHIVYNTQITDTLPPIQWGITTLSTINIRKEPNQQSELISQSIMGMPVIILNKKSNWLYIQTIDGYKGWTNYYSINILGNKQQLISFWNTYPLYIVIDYFGIIHSFPNMQSPVVSDIVFNNIVRVTNKTAHFYEILLPNGKKGYVEKQKLQPLQDLINKQEYNPELLPDIAKKFLGFPYSWGGASIKGMDCSSFMQIIFFQQGLILPRDAKLQIGLGEEIDTTQNFSKLHIGDLLFFGKKEIKHVAMYIGNQQYIHCFGEVKINSLNNTAINYNRLLKDILVKVKRLEKNNLPQIKLTYFLYTLFEK